MHKHTDLEVEQMAFAGDAAETKTWIQFTVECGYIDRSKAKTLYMEYDSILGMLVTMISNPDSWTLPSPKK